MKSAIRILLSVLILVFLSAFAYTHWDQIQSMVQRWKNQTFPCQQPIAYSIGSFDKRFGVSQKDFLNAIGQAEQIWEKPVHQQLFSYDKTGSLKINLVYDYRQAATLKLQQLGIEIRDDQASYDQLKIKYNSSSASYQQQKAALENLVAAYQIKKQSYEAEVNAWNKQGGAPPEEFQKLEQKRNELNILADQINQTQKELNGMVDTINSLVTVLNRQASNLNLVATKFNTVGQSQGAEFEEGLYQSDARGNAITIYQFDNQQKLVRVLAHEMGHALGLGHLNNPAAIMYRLNQGKNEKLTADDIAALKQRCRIPTP